LSYLVFIILIMS